MAPLEIEVFNSNIEDWAHVRKLEPGESATISDKPHGIKEYYVFQCRSNDEKSIVWRPLKNIILEKPGATKVWANDAEVVATLSRGDSFELSVQNDDNSTSSRIRITHT